MCSRDDDGLQRVVSVMKRDCGYTGSCWPSFNLKNIVGGMKRVIKSSEVRR